MTMTDPIADMLTRVRNGLQVQKRFVDVPSSRMKSNIALVMKDEGYLTEVESMQDAQDFPVLRLHLKYDQDGAPVIRELKRVSKPGCRVYADSTRAPKVRGGLGISILTTSKGVMSGRKAAEAGVGGEVLCTVF
ncbi:MAG: 30S ribosomal protein S8 [Planctomycetes bacterium]|nr:30S ribosomal protein S8 [Planctomycetota bacterium]